MGSEHAAILGHVAGRRLRRITRVAGMVTLVAGVSARAAVELTHITPPPQPPLAVVRDSLGAVREAFNAAVHRPRLVMMLSPT